MKPEIKMKQYFLCPECGETEFSVDHLIERKSKTTFGPWHCKNLKCSKVIKGTVNGDNIDVVTEDCDRYPTLSLLKLRGMYLIVSHQVIGEENGVIDNWDFFFHSHQCPYNLFHSVVAVFDHEDSDPHGVMRFVSSIRNTSEISKELDEVSRTTDLLELFKTDGIPLKSEWPILDKGVLDWIAEMKREAKSED